MANVPLRSSFWIPLLLFFLLLGTSSSSMKVVVAGGDSAISLNGGMFRSLSAAQKNRYQIADCREMASKSECLQNKECRWCRSEAIDDMCFSKTEAWRLPSQVFSCD